MDKIETYRKAIIASLKEYKEQFGQTSQGIHPQILIDDKNDHYQFLWLGWKGDCQIFSVPVHVDILGNKIWIQQDNTEEGIANLLVKKGIPKSDIVLAYYSPAHRKLTEFAVS